MTFLRRGIFKRFQTLGLASDIAMVAAAARRVVRRPGGAGASVSQSAFSRPGEMMLVAGAAFRLLKRIRQVRRKRRRGSVD